MSEHKERPIFNFNFHGNVGQQIGNVEHMEVHFDKDMQMQVANVEMVRGPHKKCLFMKDGCDTKENEAVKNREKERLCAYLSKHCLKSRKLICTKEDTLNKTIVCFLLKWMEKGFVSDNPSGGAIFRFLTGDCGMVSEVQEKAYSNRIKEWIKDRNGYDTEVMLMVRGAFVKNN